MSSTLKAVLLVVLVALLLRGALLLAVSAGPERVMHRDTGSYVQPALNLLAGNGFSQEQAPPYTPDACRTPIYPLFVAMLYGLFGQQPLAVSAAQVVLGALTAGAACFLGRQLLLDREARLGAFLLALSLGAIVYTAYLLAETLFTALLLGMAWAVVLCRQRREVRWLAAAGALAGLAMLCRPIALLYPIAAVPLIGLGGSGPWRRRVWAAFVFLGTAALIVAPWLVRNQCLLGTPTLSTISSTNLLLYNAASLEADLRGVGQAQVRAELAEQLEDELARQGGADDDAMRARLSGEWGREIILAHPWRYVIVHLKNDLNSLLPSATEFLELLGVTRGGKGTLSVLNQQGLRAAVQHYFGDRTWLVWVTLPFLALLALVYLGAILGAVTLARRRDWFTLALLVLPVAYFLLIPGAPSHPRFRVPVMPYVCLLAGTGLMTCRRLIIRKLASRGSARRKPAIPKTNP